MSPLTTRRVLGTDPDQGFRLGHSVRRPVFARDLLKALDVEREPLEAQRAAVQKWLEENKPGRALSRSLRRARLA